MLSLSITRPTILHLAGRIHVHTRVQPRAETGASLRGKIWRRMIAWRQSPTNRPINALSSPFNLRSLSERFPSRSGAGHQWLREPRRRGCCRRTSCYNSRCQESWSVAGQYSGCSSTSSGSRRRDHAGPPRRWCSSSSKCSSTWSSRPPWGPLLFWWLSRIHCSSSSTTRRPRSQRTSPCPCQEGPGVGLPCRKNCTDRS
mmetsp:Transcript_36195/g.54626  ORF Transcript_36195/g.54626 Transcript_36195/m.54626 type:complete len:200 (-) Transcript_36195:331-930(-)